MNKDKQIEDLYKQLFWQELQHKARETYLQRRIEQLEEKLRKNSSEDK
jgi:hypothetical protein